MPPLAIRLAVGSATGRRSSSWRFWFGHDDIYASMRSLGGVLKASVHYPRPPRLPNTRRVIAFTREYFESDEFAALPGAPARDTRVQQAFSGFEFAPGFFLEFRFHVPESELIAFEADTTGMIWLPTPPVSKSAEAIVISAPPGYTGPVPTRSDGAPMTTLLEATLASGRRVWVVHHEVASPSPEQIAPLRAGWRERASASGVELERAPNIRAVLLANHGDGSGMFIEVSVG